MGQYSEIWLMKLYGIYLFMHVKLVLGPPRESISIPYPYVVWSALVHGSNRVSKCAKENHMGFRLAGFSGIDKSDAEKLGYLETSNEICQSCALCLSVTCAAEQNRETLYFAQLHEWVKTRETSCLTVLKQD